MLPGINTQNLIGVINAVTDFSAFEDNKVTTALKKNQKQLRCIFITTPHPFFQSHSNQTNAKAISRR